MGAPVHIFIFDMLYIVWQKITGLWKIIIFSYIPGGKKGPKGKLGPTLEKVVSSLYGVIEALPIIIIIVPVVKIIVLIAVTVIIAVKYSIILMIVKIMTIILLIFILVMMI